MPIGYQSWNLVDRQAGPCMGRCISRCMVGCMGAWCMGLVRLGLGVGGGLDGGGEELVGGVL